MSISKLLKFTNSKEFYQNAHFNCVKIKTENDNHRNVVFDFINEYEGDMEKINIQKWRIFAHRCEKFHDMYRKISLPWIQLKLFTDHPLLWEYKSNMLRCQLIGYPKDIDTFLGQIYQEYIKVSGNWIQATKHFYATEYGYKKNGKISITIPENLKGSIEHICKTHQVSFEVKETEEQQDYNLKNVKILVFGNDYVSPDGFNMGQPYIIAHDFFAKKIYG